MTVESTFFSPLIMEEEDVLYKYAVLFMYCGTFEIRLKCFHSVLEGSTRLVYI